MSIHLVNLGPIVFQGGIFIPMGPVYFGVVGEDGPDPHRSTITVEVRAARDWSKRRVQASIRKVLGRSDDNVLVDTTVEETRRRGRPTAYRARLFFRDGHARSPTEFRSVVKQICAALRESIPGASVRTKTSIALESEPGGRLLEGVDAAPKMPSARVRALR